MFRKITALPESQIVTIAGDGAISNPDIASGKLIPVLILNCDNRRDLHDLIMLHQGMRPGDLSSIWAHQLLDRRYLYLKLEFLRPTPGFAVIPFKIEKHISLIDGILQTHGVYLQSNSFGSTMADPYDQPKILIEVTASPPFDWNKFLKKYFIKRFRRDGLNFKESKEAAKQHIHNSRRVWDFRKIQSTSVTDMNGNQ